MTQQSTSLRCPCFDNCRGLSSTEQNRCVHVLLKLISVGDTSMTTGKNCLVSAALSRNTLSPSLPIRLLNTLPTRLCHYRALSRKLGSNRSTFVGCGTRSASEFVTSLCALCREGHKQPEVAQDPLVNACSDLDAEQRATAMHHGMLKRPPTQQDDKKFDETLELHDNGHLVRRLFARKPNGGLLHLAA